MREFDGTHAIDRVLARVDFVHVRVGRACELGRFL